MQYLPLFEDPGISMDKWWEHFQFPKLSLQTGGLRELLLLCACCVPEARSSTTFGPGGYKWGNSTAIPGTGITLTQLMQIIQEQRATPIWLSWFFLHAPGGQFFDGFCFTTPWQARTAVKSGRRLRELMLKFASTATAGSETWSSMPSKAATVDPGTFCWTGTLASTFWTM